MRCRKNVKKTTGIEGEIANRNPGDTDYPRKAWEYMLALQQSRSLVRVVTRLKTYRNLLITNLSSPQTSAEGLSIKFSCMCEEIQIVDSASVQLPENVIAADATGAATKANKGSQSTSAASGAQEQNVSIIKGTVNAFQGGG